MSNEKVDIICSFCRERVGFVIPSECDLPLRGSMVHPHVGCESWPLPLPMHGPLEFVCPHAVEDQHLFIDIVEGRHEESLHCYRRHVAQLKAEIEDGRDS
jgi:hypothetical protein